MRACVEKFGVLGWTKYSEGLEEEVLCLLALPPITQDPSLNHRAFLPKASSDPPLSSPTYYLTISNRASTPPPPHQRQCTNYGFYCDQQICLQISVKIIDNFPTDNQDWINTICHDTSAKLSPEL